MPALSLRPLVVALALGAGGCASSSEEDVASQELAAVKPELRASAWVKLWSDLPKERGAQAHFRACEGQPFRFTLSFRNMGSAVWRDEPGRGDEVGSDVFLETASGKADRLTGKPRYSLRWNANDWVRGDRKAKECTMSRGCRRTRAIHDGIDAKAPAQPGVYKSRWRLRDYSKAWSNPRGFGPKAELRVRVEHCPRPDECACKVECSDGSRTKLWMVGGSDSACKSQADLFCLPYEATVHQLETCGAPAGGAGGSGGAGSGGAGSGGGANAEEPPDGPGYWITDGDLPAGGAAGAAGGGGAGGGGWGDEDDTGIGTDEVSDDPDYESDGFDGVAEDVRSGTIPIEKGCAFIASTRPASTGPLVVALLGFCALLRRRPRQKAS
ncbi:MAG: hypothetical protein HYZ29_15455 [Myxococcales bacterium]|nr:hypothetical protein [Myxococcales bacterium]